MFSKRFDFLLRIRNNALTIKLFENQRKFNTRSGLQLAKKARPTKELFQIKNKKFREPIDSNKS